MNNKNNCKSSLGLITVRGATISALLLSFLVSANSVEDVNLKSLSHYTSSTTLQRVLLMPKQARSKLTADTLDTLEVQGLDILENSLTSDSVEVIASNEELSQLIKQGYQIKMLEKGSPFGKSDQAMPVNSSNTKTMALAPPSGYKNLAQLNQQLAAIAALNPDIAQVVDLTEKYNLPTTVEGRHMFAIKISDNVATEEDEPAMLIVSNHHVRELVTPEIALNAALNFVQYYGSNSDVTQAVNNNEIWIAANWNPDGYAHVFEVDNMWRKNRKVLTYATGVDLNRNYPVGWNTSCSGSTSESSQTYKGTEQGSEVEIQTMMAWANDQRFAKVIDFHSSGREVLWDYHPSCANHPFEDYHQDEGILISQNMQYNRWRSATALGENFQWHIMTGANAYLIETHEEFQPSFTSAQAEAEQLWPGILAYANRHIPVTGHVVDKNNQALSGVDIKVLNYSFPFEQTNLTSSTGRHHQFLPAGNYQLKFSKQGYSSVTKSVTVTADNNQILDAILEPTTGDGILTLINNETVTAISASKGEFLYYKYTLPVGTDHDSLSFTLSGGSGDADLYVNYGDKPTTSNYDCRPYATGNNENCDIASVNAGIYYIGLHAYSDFSAVELVASSSASSTDDGLNLTNLSALNGTETHYSFDIATGKTLADITMSGGSGDADLYVKFGSAPSQSDYTCRPYKNGNSEDCQVSVSVGTVYIMIRAYSSYTGVSLSAKSE